MKKIVCFVLAVIMIMGLVACGDSGTTSGAASGTTSTPAGTTSGTTPDPDKKVRTDLNIALNAAPATADPMGNSKDAVMQLNQWVHDGLVYADSEAKIHPRLAESWTISADGTQYVFKIRQGVKFHSGKEMTVEDVVFSLERNKSMSYMKNYTGGIEKIEKTGDWEVTVTLAGADNGFLYNLFNLKIVDKAQVDAMGDDFGNKPNYAGAGPYKIVSWDPNTLIKLERHEDYYGECGNIETVNVHVVSNASTRVTALQTGELDFITVPSANWDQVQKSGKFNTVLASGTRTLQVVLNWYREGSPMNDKRVRQAVKYATNRDAIVQVAAGGLGEVAIVQCNPKFIMGSSSEGFEDSFKYDPEKAKQLLADAGYPNGVELGILLVTNTYDNEAVAQMLQNMWEQVGIKCTIAMAESSTASALSKDGYQDFYITVANYVHHMSNLKRAIHSSSYKTTVAKYSGPAADEIDSYMDNAQAALTDKERDEWYQKANEFLLDFAVNFPIYYLSNPYAWDKDLDATIGTYYLYIQEWNWT